jgi:hypothetical protein
MRRDIQPSTFCAADRANVFGIAFKEKLLGAEARLNELGITLPAMP